MLPGLLLGPSWPVNTRDPVNRAHPLNRGRVGWWLGLPGTAGGRTLYDLTGLAHAALFTPGASSVAWVPGFRPGAQTSNVRIVTQSLINNLLVGNPPHLQITAAITVACWARWNSALTGSLSNTPIMAKWGNSPGWVLLTASPNKVQWIGSISGSKSATSTLSYGDDAWHRFVGTYDGANVTLYVDGFQVAQTAATGSIANPAEVVRFGNYSSVNADNTTFPGHLDDLSIWNRALSASEVRADYDLSRLGYPGALNRLSPSVAVVATSTGNRRRRVLLCAGGG